MPILAAAGAILLIFIVLWDAFETIILPRRVTRRLRIARVVYSLTWAPWASWARHMRDNSRRELFLSFYGPLALIFLLSVWVVLLILGYAIIQWALGSALITPIGTGHAGFGTDLYMSGTTFFTLGLGDVVPDTPLARVATVAEAGTGFGILALVIGYLPVLYQAFSRREANITLLDARAGSPPSAGEMLRRNCYQSESEAIRQLLSEWERWSAELLESHLSYPSLGYFRSQHDNQSWLAALTCLLDVCALIMAGIDGLPTKQARLTFAIARHAAVDLSQVFNAPPHTPEDDRLPPADVERLRSLLEVEGLILHWDEAAIQKLTKLRHFYEPYVHALSHHLLLDLPPWLPAPDAHDDWQTSTWERSNVAPPAPMQMHS
jgi:voltage-gated potassium channel Kch